ncbi:hypothetical protein E2C01_075280 [Portunus trituberculatus]|uniref:Uncharacterized protein n=1 Tax=Portunus trituberculatus TaxID=210409 RepID=A0A5B7IEK5_PORTR|nr:hypothetical protein [Portunus trituberculatus]
MNMETRPGIEMVKQMISYSFPFFRITSCPKPLKPSASTSLPAETCGGGGGEEAIQDSAPQYN